MKNKPYRTTQDIANDYAGHICTINGEPGKVTGRLNRFATVGSFCGTYQAEFAWSTVERIMRDGYGEFEV